MSQSASALSFQYHSTILDTNLIRTSKETHGAFQQRNSILDIGEHVKYCSPLVRSSHLPLALLSSAAAFFLASAKRSLMEDESATEFILASFGLALSRPKAFWIKLVRSWKEKVKVKRDEQSYRSNVFDFLHFSLWRVSFTLLVVATLLDGYQPGIEAWRHHSFSDKCRSVSKNSCSRT